MLGPRLEPDRHATRAIGEMAEARLDLGIDLGGRPLQESPDGRVPRRLGEEALHRHRSVDERRRDAVGQAELAGGDGRRIPLEGVRDAGRLERRPVDADADGGDPVRPDVVRPRQVQGRLDGGVAARAARVGLRRQLRPDVAGAEPADQAVEVVLGLEDLEEAVAAGEDVGGARKAPLGQEPGQDARHRHESVLEDDGEGGRLVLLHLARGLRVRDAEGVGDRRRGKRQQLGGRGRLGSGHGAGEGETVARNVDRLVVRARNDDAA